MKIRWSILYPRRHSILQKWIVSDLFNEVITQSFKIVVFNILAAIFLLFSNYLLINFFGEKIYGQYIGINIWFNLLSIICLFGLDDYFIAILPKFYLQPNHAKTLNAILAWSIRTCFLIFAVISLVVLAVFYFDLTESVFSHYLYLSLLLLLCITLLQLFIAYLRGLNKIVIGQLIEKIIRPVIFLLGIVFIIFFNINYSFKAILLCQFISVLICILILIIFLRTSFQSNQTDEQFDKSGKSNIIYLGISLGYLISTKVDMLYLSSVMSPEQIGHYNIAARFSDFAAYPLNAFNLLMPTFLSKAFYHQQGKIKRLIKRMIGFSVGIMMFILLFIILFGEKVLALFGNNFISAYWPLIILASSHLFAASTAPLNTLLMISGQQRFSLITLIIFAVSTFSLCFLLIPIYSMIGGALAVLGGSIIYFLCVCYFSQKKVVANLNTVD